MGLHQKVQHLLREQGTEECSRELGKFALSALSEYARKGLPLSREQGAAPFA